jgi:leader peptidase (prepilin peptidase)/N-methyltransferase
MLAALLAGLFGLIIGSFLNACIFRFPRDITIWDPPRSFCPECEHTIAWYDNIPALSYLLLRGRCRHCRAPIPIRYLVVELLCGAMFFAIVKWLGLTPEAAKMCLFAAINLQLAATDFEERILPDEFTLGGTLAGLALAWFVPLPPMFSVLLVPAGSSPGLYSLVESALGAAIGYGSLWTIAAVYQRLRGHEGMGMGDFKMAAMVGAFLGLMPMMLTLMAGSIIGSIAGLAAIFIGKKEAATYEIPFGSFMAIAALGVAVFEAVVH